MAEYVYVAGVGMTRFTQPKRAEQATSTSASVAAGVDYPSMAHAAASAALLDARSDYAADVQAAVASYCYGEPTAGQCALYTLGTTGVPIFNTNNNCSSASSAIMLGRALVMSGEYDCVLAVGFEQMERGLSERYGDRVSPVAKHFGRIETLSRRMHGGKFEPLPNVNKMTGEVIRLYAMAAVEYQQKYGNCADVFAKIAVKNRTHGAHNPLAALHSKPIPSLEQARDGRMVCAPITMHQCALTADGAAAAILCSERWLRNKPWIRRRATPIVAQRMRTDTGASFDSGFMQLSGAHMAADAALQCFSESSSDATAVSVCELHDCFAPNELFMYESLGFTAAGTGARFLQDGSWADNGYGGRLYTCNGTVFNASGGLVSKGHPIGATGLGQCYEIVKQLRGETTPRERQVPPNGNKPLGLQHNFGIGGAAVVTLYSRPNFGDTAKL